MQKSWVIGLLLVVAVAMGSVLYYETNPAQPTDTAALPPVAQSADDTPGATTPEGGGADGIIPPTE